MPEQINQITRVERMLESLLLAKKKIYWIGGYIYGRTSVGDPFITLYPAADYLSEKVCKVYDQDFKKLPDFIDTANFPEKDFFQSSKRAAAPDRDTAIERGWYRYCPMFKVCLYDGDDTPLGPEQRFAHVLVITNKTSHVPIEGETAVPANGSQPPATAPASKPVQDKRGAQSPQAQAERKESQSQTPEWEFYTAVYKANSVVYQSAKQVKMIADRIDPTWQHGAAPADDVAMSNALGSYAKKRAELEDAKKDQRTCHNEALKKAVATFTAVTQGA